MNGATYRDSSDAYVWVKVLRHQPGTLLMCGTCSQWGPESGTHSEFDILGQTKVAPYSQHCSISIPAAVQAVSDSLDPEWMQTFGLEVLHCSWFVSCRHRVRAVSQAILETCPRQNVLLLEARSAAAH